MDSDMSKRKHWSNLSVKVKIIVISLTLCSSLLTYCILFAVRPLRLRLFVSELPVAQGSSVKVWKHRTLSWPWISVISSHCSPFQITPELWTGCLTYLLNESHHFDRPFGWHCTHHTSHNQVKDCRESEHHAQNRSAFWLEEGRRQRTLNLSHPVMDLKKTLEVFQFPLFKWCASSVRPEAPTIGNLINWINEKQCIFFHSGEPLLIEAIYHICVKQLKILFVWHPSTLHIFFYNPKCSWGCLKCFSMSPHIFLII